MAFYQVEPLQKFVGRTFEKQRLNQLFSAPEAQILFVYGRRRVGKTELIEQTFASRSIYKFEGIEVEKPKTLKNKNYQLEQALAQLGQYIGDPLLNHLKLKRWRDFFELLARYVAKGPITLYFEEVQWLASYQFIFFSEFKYVWDNFLKKNKQLIVIFCGSSPAFLTQALVSNKALYNRSQNEIHLKPFSLNETHLFLGKKSQTETMLAYLTVGGIPEYLKYLQKDASVWLSLLNNSFMPQSFFSREKNKIFVSSLSQNSNFEKIIDYLAKQRWASRNQIAKHLKMDTGGRLTQILNELCDCDFIEKYNPLHLNEDSLVSRYCIKDPYLEFYFSFIKPQIKKIEAGQFIELKKMPISSQDFAQWAGFAFERFCRRQGFRVAEILGFSAVEYRVGSFFNRDDLQNKTNFQVDLMFLRSDHVITICECKWSQNLIRKTVQLEVERKIEKIKEVLPQSKRHRIEKVLITNTDADSGLKNNHYFDRILTLSDFFKYSP